MKELVQPRRLQVPVDGQYSLSGSSQDPGHIGQCHRPAGTALIRVEGNDLALAGLAHQVPPGSWGWVPRSRGRLITGPAGGWASASLQNRFIMIRVISGRIWPKS